MWFHAQLSQKFLNGIYYIVKGRSFRRQYRHLWAPMKDTFSESLNLALKASWHRLKIVMNIKNPIGMTWLSRILHLIWKILGQVKKLCSMDHPHQVFIQFLFSLAFIFKLRTKFKCFSNGIPTWKSWKNHFHLQNSDQRSYYLYLFLWCPLILIRILQVRS